MAVVQVTIQSPREREAAIPSTSGGPCDISDYFWRGFTRQAVSVDVSDFSSSRPFRIWVVIGECIDEIQTAFVEGRNILEGPLIVNELCSGGKKANKKILLFKADFKKVVDSVNWNFLDSMMRQMNFGIKWSFWMKGCLESARASVLVNGCPTEEFQLEKGVRQRDPLSSLLFILGLKIPLKEATTKGIFQRISIPNSNIKLSHLFYADDALCIGEWPPQKIKNLARRSSLTVDFKENRASLGAAFRYRKSLFLGTPGASGLPSGARGSPRLRGGLKPLERENSDIIRRNQEESRWDSDFAIDEKFHVAALRGRIDRACRLTNDKAFTWSKWIPNKVNCFVWGAGIDCIPSASALMQRGVQIQGETCGSCISGSETADHMLVTCPFATTIWNRIWNWCEIIPPQLSSIKEILNFVATCGKSPKKKKTINSIILKNTMGNVESKK
uniref:Reverse transcriptase domain-containing protein n=1 Tax=Lactuca sativa TaxID=4236 RepID=A0A9R1VEB0_LACSA|nr:hypothetical protein LSAT_V11C500260820 [Lactuca sativa]